MKKYINFNYKYNSDEKERAKLIKEVGFDGVFIYSQYKPEYYIDYILKEELDIETLHLPYKRFIGKECVDSKYVNILWNSDEDANSYLNELKSQIDFAEKYSIRKVVMHVTGGKNPPPVSRVGLERVLSLLEYCEKRGIVLCLENLRRLDYLEYLFNNINSNYLQFCFDSGHANYMTHNINSFPWEMFGKKLSCVHLNDNDGTKDAHLIPYLGLIEWEKLMKCIVQYKKDINLTLEVRATEQQRYSISEIEFLRNCYNSLIDIEKGI